MSHKFSTRSTKQLKVLQIFVSLGALVFLSTIFFWNTLSHFSSHLTSPNDGLLISWLINQSAAFWKGTQSLYDWPIFYPYRFTASFSDPFLSLGLLQLLLRPLIVNVVVQQNTMMLISFFSTFFGMFFLAKLLFKNNFIALFVAISFCFSFLYLQFIVHLHTFFLVGLPIFFIGIIQYLKKPHIDYLLLAALGFLLQAFNAPMTAYFIGITALIYLASENRLKKLFMDYKAIFVGVIVISLCVWYYLPSFRVAQEFNAIRTIRDTAHFSYPISRLLGLDILLPIAAIFLSWRFFKKKYIKTFKARTWIMIALFGSLAMLGPVIKINELTFKIFGYPIPLPYAIIYYVIPGLQAFRAVTRWSILLNFGLSLGIGWVLSNRKVPLFLVSFYGVLWLAQMWYLYNRHIFLYPISTEIAPIYSVIKNRPETVLAEFPITQWDMAPFDGLENQRLSQQLYHQKKLYNGVSGFMPPDRSNEINFHFSHFPDSLSLQILRQNQVELVLVHYDEYQNMSNQHFIYGADRAPQLSDLKQAVINQPQLLLISCTDNLGDCVYQLKP